MHQPRSTMYNISINPVFVFGAHNALLINYILYHVQNIISWVVNIRYWPTTLHDARWNKLDIESAGRSYSIFCIAYYTKAYCSIAGCITLIVIIYKGTLF